MTKDCRNAHRFASALILSPFFPSLPDPCLDIHLMHFKKLDWLKQSRSEPRTHARLFDSVRTSFARRTVRDVSVRARVGDWLDVTRMFRHCPARPEPHWQESCPIGGADSHASARTTAMGY